MKEEKDLSNPTPTTTDSTQLTDVESVQKQLEKEYRTDHLTLPVLAPLPNKERQKASDIERKAILNPNANEDTVVDATGTTLKELREQIQFGIMGKDAPKKAKDGIGKHEVNLGKDSEGNSAVIVTPPNDGDKVVISEPVIADKDDKTPAGMELMHSTSPVPDQNKDTIVVDNKPMSEGDTKK